MSALCLTCHAAVPVGTEMCANCRTTLAPRLDAQALLGEETGPLVTLSQEDALLADADSTEVPFCGREAELGTLLGLVEQSIKSHSLRCFWVSAQTGQGKSRLLSELRRAIPQFLGVPPDRVLHATIPGEGATPLAGFVELIRRRCDLRWTEPEKTGRDKLLRFCRVLLPAVRATEVAHVLGEVLGLSFPDSPLVSFSHQASLRHESRTHAAIRRFFVADARRGPLVLLLDDMDLCSHETVSLLSYLLDGFSDLPVVVGLFGEPEFAEKVPDFFAMSGPVTKVDLQPLSSSEKLFLLAQVVGAEPEELPTWLSTLGETFAESSPRAMVEILRLLVETQVLSWIPGDGDRALVPVWDEEKRAELVFPSSLPGVVEARLSAMAESSRRLLEWASVAGENFHLGALLCLSRSETHGLLQEDSADPDGPSFADLQDGDPQHIAELSDLCEQLIGQGVLAAVPSSQLGVEKELRFVYPPWKETIYDQIPAQRRRAYHLLLSQFWALQPDADREEIQQRIARHCERAGEGVLAAQAYERAAELLEKTGSGARAPKLYLRGLACLPRGHLAERVALWQKTARAFATLGDCESALSAWEKVVRQSFLLASRKTRAQAFLEMARLLAQDPARALPHLESARALFSQIQDQVGLSDVLDEEGQALLWLGKTTEGADKLVLALEMRRRLSDRKSVARSLLHVAEMEMRRGALSAALENLEEALRKHDGDVRLQAAALTATGCVELARGEVMAARIRFEDALPLCERLGPSQEHVWLLCCLCDALLRSNLLGEAESRLLQAKEMAVRLLDGRGHAESLRLLALIQHKRGNKQKALELSQKSLEKAQATGSRCLIARSLLSLGELHATTLFDETVEGEHPAWDYLKRAVALLREGVDQIELARGLAAFGKLLIERRKLGPGRAALREAFQLANHMQMNLADELAPLLRELGG